MRFALMPCVGQGWCLVGRACTTCHVKLAQRGMTKPEKGVLSFWASPFLLPEGPRLHLELVRADM